MRRVVLEAAVARRVVRRRDDDAVDLTVAAINRVSLEGNVERQAEQIRSVMAIVFPEAVTLVREARQGLQ